ncbi:MAG TPA: hypothetical protein GXX35_10770 [Thermoanaerobacterales bacterium]|nr:hypothetical protein [Thermoanaerobacterales bacterium]
MTIVVDDEKSNAGIQNPEMKPQQQDRKRRLIIIGDIISIIGVSLLFTAAILDLFIDTTFRP